MQLVLEPIPQLQSHLVFGGKFGEHLYSTSTQSCPFSFLLF